MALWGVDLGGTKVEAVVLSGPSPESQIIRKRLPTESHRGYDAIVERVGELIELTAREAGLPKPEVIGFGTPGSADPLTGLMRNCNTTCLNDKSLPADLARATGARAIVANDANCFALAEAMFGAGRGAKVVFGIIMGTGVGGGVVVNGEALNGRHGIAGEWGHNVADPAGPACYCGKSGCLEKMCAGPNLEAYYKELTGEAKPLVEIWQESSPASRKVADRLIDLTAEQLGRVINVLDPDVVIFGGGVGQSQVIYDEMPQAIRRWVFHPHCSTEIRRPTLGDSAGVFGAALLAASAG